MTDSTPAPRPRRQRGRFVVAAAMLAGSMSCAAPAAASMTKTRLMQRDGQIVIVSQDVGNQALPVQWAANDARRHAEDGLTLYYRIDRSELPPGISWEETETAIESAVATFNAEPCGRNLRLERVDVDVTGDLGYYQHLVEQGGSSVPRADITFAGWVPPSFMAAAGEPGSFGLTVPAVYDAADDSQVWGLGILDDDRPFSDIDHDGRPDLYAMEIYFSTAGNYVVDDDELANTLFYIDVESIALHELGHALGMAHFGRTKVILDENGDLVDLVINPHSVPVMNTNNYFVKRDLMGSDRASFCELYAPWGK
jgi:Matrixin